MSALLCSLQTDCLIRPHYSQTSPSVVVPALSDDVPGPSQLSTPLQPSSTGRRPTDHKTAQQSSAYSEAPYWNPCWTDVEHTSVLFVSNGLSCNLLTCISVPLIIYTGPQCIMVARRHGIRTCLHSLPFMRQTCIYEHPSTGRTCGVDHVRSLMHPMIIH